MNPLQTCQLTNCWHTPDAWEDLTPTSVDQEKLKVEQRNADIEQQKAEIERQKVIAEEQDKNRSYWISVAQVLGATVAIGIPVWLAFLQNRNDKIRRREEQGLEFQLKAAEIAMNATESSFVRGRAAALQALFPERLPPDFAKSLDTTKIPFGGAGTQMRLEMLKWLAEYPEHRQFIVNAWGALWPSDKDPKWDPNKLATPYVWLDELGKCVADKKVDE